MNMPKYSTVVKSDICGVNETMLLITVTWDFLGLEITWQGFDMEFQEFFDFLSKLKSNESCRLSGGGNSGWELDHRSNSDFCTMKYDISGSGGDSYLKLKMKNEMITDAIEKICTEIILYQNKYPYKDSF